MKILFLSKWFPYPTDNGSKIRIYNLLRGLATAHEVTLLTFRQDTGPVPAELAALCSRVVTVPARPFDPGSGRALLGFFSRVPRSVKDTYSPEMAAAIGREVDRDDLDLIIASEWQMAAYAPSFRGIPALFEEVELALYFERIGAATTPWERSWRVLSWEKHRRFLAGLAPYFRGATVVSASEAALLREHIPAYERVAIVPNGVAAGLNRPAGQTPDSQRLIFTGPFRYWVNYDAMDWFIKEIYGRIKARVPSAELVITGDHAGRSLPEAPDVTLTGFVDDIHSLIAGSAVSLVPLRAGGGTRLKILEALALETAVVSTAKGAEGLDVVDGEHLLLADAPADFAEAVIRLLENPALRRRLGRSGRALVCEKYDWGTILPRFLKVVDEAAGVAAPIPA